MNPDLVTHDARGELSTVRYEAVNAMLLNEFLKEHRTVQCLQRMVAQQHDDFETTITELKNEMKAVTARSKEQASQIQKVSAQLEVSRPASQTALNNH